MDKGTEYYRRFTECGDEDALTSIVRDYKDGLIFYLNGFVRDLTVAEELCEDTFVLIFTEKPLDKGRGSFKTWLYTIGRNRAIDYLRSKKRHPEVALDDVDYLTDEEESFENAVIREEEKKDLYAAMKKLKPEYLRVLWLVYFEGFSNKEVSEISGKSVHAVETLVYRARLALKAELEKEGFEYEGL